LEKQEDFEVLGKYESGALFLNTLKSSSNPQPDIVLLDLTMKEMSGFEVLEKIKKQKTKIKIIAISMHEDGNYISKCARLGAHGYLLKNTAEEELLKAIYKVQAGHKYYSEKISSLMIQYMSIEGSNPKKLSKKENEILQLIAKGLTSKEIAPMLFISVRTVETHRNNILKKLEVKNTAELINKATKLQLLQ
jgi:DNA-binding NarL/FixJ family response regulator